MQPEELAKRLDHIEQEIASLRNELQSMRIEEARVEYLTTEVVTPARVTEVSKDNLIVEAMHREGLLSNPTPEEVAFAHEWEALPEAEQRAHIDLMHSLQIDPPLSEIIIQNRR